MHQAAVPAPAPLLMSCEILRVVVTEMASINLSPLSTLSPRLLRELKGQQLYLSAFSYNLKLFMQYLHNIFPYTLYAGVSSVPCVSQL